MKKALPSLVEVYNILNQDDSQKGFSGIVVPPTAFQVSEMASSPMVDIAVCYVQSGPNKGCPICSFCNRVGHIADRCYKKHEFSPGFTPKGRAPDKFQTPRPVAAQVALSPLPEASNANLEGMIGNLSKDQIQKFIAMFSTHLQTTSHNDSATASSSQSKVDNIGISFSPSTYCFVGILTVSQHIYFVYSNMGN